MGLQGVEDGDGLRRWTTSNASATIPPLHGGGAADTGNETAKRTSRVATNNADMKRFNMSRASANITPEDALRYVSSR